MSKLFEAALLLSFAGLGAAGFAIVLARYGHRLTGFIHRISRRS